MGTEVKSEFCELEATVTTESRVNKAGEPWCVVGLPNLHFRCG